jgi:hypothetical protein
LRPAPSPTYLSSSVRPQAVTSSRLGGFLTGYLPIQEAITTEFSWLFDEGAVNLATQPTPSTGSVQQPQVAQIVPVAKRKKGDKPQRPSLRMQMKGQMKAAKRIRR